MLIAIEKSHCWYFLQWFVEVKKVIRFCSIDSILFHDVWDILPYQRHIFMIKFPHYLFLRFETNSLNPLLLFPFQLVPILILFFYFLHHILYCPHLYVVFVLCFWQFIYFIRHSYETLVVWHFLWEMWIYIEKWVFFVLILSHLSFFYCFLIAPFIHQIFFLLITFYL